MRKGSGVRSSSRYWRELYNYHPSPLSAFFFKPLPVSDSTRSVPRAKRHNPKLVIPSSQGWGIGLQNFYPRFLVRLCLVSFFTTHSDRTQTSVSWPCSSLHVQYRSADLKNLPAKQLSRQLQLPNQKWRL